MQTNKERFITALQEPLETTFATYKKPVALWSSWRSSRRKPRYLWRKCHHKGQEDSMIKKDLRIDHQSFYGDFVGYCPGFLHHQCLASKARWAGSNDLYHHCDLGLDLWWGSASFKNCGATKLPATYHVWLSIQRPFCVMDQNKNSDRWNRCRRWWQTGAGDMIPADVVLIDSRDFFVQQSGLTGESDAVEKVCL